MLSGRSWHGEIVNRRKDGSFYVEDQTITPVRDAGGGIRHLIAIKQDITGRKEAATVLAPGEGRPLDPAHPDSGDSAAARADERASAGAAPPAGLPGACHGASDRRRAGDELLRSESGYRALAENLGEGVALVDPDERVVFANPAAEAVFGVGRGCLIGHHVTEFVSREVAESIRRQTVQRSLGQKVRLRGGDPARGRQPRGGAADRDPAVRRNQRSVRGQCRRIPGYHGLGKGPSRS